MGHGRGLVTLPEAACGISAALSQALDPVVMLLHNANDHTCAVNKASVCFRMCATLSSNDGTLHREGRWVALWSSALNLQTQLHVTRYRTDPFEQVPDAEGLCQPHMQTL